ncbi:MAG: metalloregulator ArsR/SmtB family transcription factor [Sedimentisphaerales bacterium]|jgi:DNA-binding transcriptional ArsR family regulator|nr:metalloregulator ArsR/SmtB family transcription factor [Sedimentisphaerales bacterium]NLT78118.1 winged helix-turn-helix transcriptional regulator [Planctomycetota bacterium]
MRDVLNITKALADGNRLRALMALADGELCVCQIIEMLSLAPSTVSKHLSILHQAGLVEARKEGRWMYYRLVNRTGSKAAREAVAWLRRNLAESRQVVEDTKTLRKIVCIDREELCRKQNRS